jgi:hypothetical protein
LLLLVVIDHEYDIFVVPQSKMLCPEEIKDYFMF